MFPRRCMMPGLGSIGRVSSRTARHTTLSGPPSFGANCWIWYRSTSSIMSGTSAGRLRGFGCASAPAHPTKRKGSERTNAEIGRCARGTPRGPCQLQPVVRHPVCFGDSWIWRSRATRGCRAGCQVDDPRLPLVRRRGGQGFRLSPWRTTAPSCQGDRPHAMNVLSRPPGVAGTRPRAWVDDLYTRPAKMPRTCGHHYQAS